MTDFYKSVLVVCRDMNALKKLSRFEIENKTRYILASNDPMVHEAAKGRCHWIDKICWLEQMESFYNVAEDVIRITETVNDWLKTLADPTFGFQKELLFFIRHVEGGMTTQRIQDLLLLIRSYHFILDTYKISSVIIISRPGMTWEDDILKQVAWNRNIDTIIIGRYAAMVLIKKAESFLKMYAREMYYVVNIIRIKLFDVYNFHKSRSTNNEILFQLCSSSYKHVEDIVSFMEALKQKDYNPIALCWHSSEKYTRNSGASQIRKKKLRADMLESYVSFSDVIRSITSAFWTWKKAKNKKHEFILSKNLEYRSTPLNSLLWPSVRFFVIAEIAQSYRLHQALKTYFKNHFPLAIKLWGATALKEGYLAYKSLGSQNKPLLFFYNVGAYMDWPYGELNSPLDLLFVAGEHHKRIVHGYKNVLSTNVEICGQAKYSNIDNFKRKFNRSESLFHLNIPNTYSMYILFDSGITLRGYFSSQEQTLILMTLLNFVAKHKSSALLIKPHPGHRINILDDIIHTHGKLKNVFLIDQKMLPYHSLNIADLLITKYSTLGIEAMLFSCPVICCVLDGEQRFKIYKKAADYIERIENLEGILLRLVTDQDFRQKWHNRHMHMQKEFLPEYFCKMDEQPAVYQANLLDKYIKKSVIPK